MKELNFQEYLEALAEEAKTNPRPWEAFDMQITEDYWVTCDTEFWPGRSCRRKPRTVTRTITLPVGLSEGIGSFVYFVPCLDSERKYAAISPSDYRPRDQRFRVLVDAGMVYATEAEAIAATNAILGVGDA